MIIIVIKLNLNYSYISLIKDLTSGNSLKNFYLQDNKKMLVISLAIFVCLFNGDKLNATWKK